MRSSPTYQPGQVVNHHRFGAFRVERVETANITAAHKRLTLRSLEDGQQYHVYDTDKGFSPA
jgi:hypothetical protein